MTLVDKALDLFSFSSTQIITFKQNYSQPHKKYHNLNHLEDMLKHLENFDNHSLVYAILFHDYCYDKVKVAAGTNEVFSILTAYDWKMFNSQIRQVSTISVVDSINATAYHHLYQDPILLCGVTKLLLDLDLNSFAKPREEFLKDTKLVQEELTPVYGPNYPEYQKGFYRKLLERPKLYYLKTEWEEPARENINYLLES